MAQSGRLDSGPQNDALAQRVLEKYRDAVRALEWTRCSRLEAEEHVRRACERLAAAGKEDPTVQEVVDAAWAEISERASSGRGRASG